MLHRQDNPEGAAARRDHVASLSVRDLTVTYPNGTTALRDATFELGPGTICGLVGVNGSGKSTLFKAIMGFVRRSAAMCALPGMPAHAGLAEEPRRLRAAERGGRLELPRAGRGRGDDGPLRPHGLPAHPLGADRRKVDEALERVGMSDYRKRQIGELSGGQKKRVFLARALAQEGQVILLDEPFTGVDVKTETAIVDLLRELNAEGRLMLVSTHNLGSVPDFCDQVVLVQRTVLSPGPTADMFTQANLETRVRRRAAPFPPRGHRSCTTTTTAAA